MASHVCSWRTRQCREGVMGRPSFNEIATAGRTANGEPFLAGPLARLGIVTP